MKKTYFLLIALLALCSHTAWGWGKMGHDAIAYIAECHLTPKAKKTIERYLNTSIVHYASWMDAYRFEEPYAHTSLWHTAWVDENNNYDPTRKADGNAIKGIEDTMELLRDYKSLDDSTVVVSIKYLVHLVGDMHCPTHVKYPGIKGFNIYVDGRKLNYHGVWDSYVLDCNVRWSAIEFQHILDRCSKREIREITAGTVRDWFRELLELFRSHRFRSFLRKNGFQIFQFQMVDSLIVDIRQSIEAKPFQLEICLQFRIFQARKLVWVNIHGMESVDRNTIVWIRVHPGVRHGGIINWQDLDDTLPGEDCPVYHFL